MKYIVVKGAEVESKEITTGAVYTTVEVLSSKATTGGKKLVKSISVASIVGTTTAGDTIVAVTSTLPIVGSSKRSHVDGVKCILEGDKVIVSGTGTKGTSSTLWTATVYVKTAGQKKVKSE